MDGTPSPGKYSTISPPVVVAEVLCELRSLVGRSVL